MNYPIFMLILVLNVFPLLPGLPAGAAASDANKAASGQGLAPARYINIIPRIGPNPEKTFKNLRYEGNNIVMRGPLIDGCLREPDGSHIAAKWQAKARGTGGLFVLRDSLFSQQDNVTQHLPHALMMPPNWVTAALASRDLKPVTAPAVDDDKAWAAIPSRRAMFGSFPGSPFLYRIATRPAGSAPDAEKERIMYVRSAIRSLASDAEAMIQASPGGPLAMAEAGAERIAASDRRYFGAELRRDRIIPIFVENPSAHEIREGKGMAVRGRKDIPGELVQLARNTIYARRLRDGDMAVERYDISKPRERKRAIELLEALIPLGAEPGANVWLWVTGPLKKPGTFSGEDATTYIGTFRVEAQKANIDLSRLRYVSKPDCRLPSGPGRKEAFEDAVDRYRKLDLPLGLNVGSGALRLLMQPPPKQ